MRKHTIKELLNKVSLCTARIDATLEDKETLTDILTCYEEIQNLVKNGKNGEIVIEKVVSGCIDLYMGLINEDIKNNNMGLRTAFTCTELLEDYVNKKPNGNGLELRLNEAMVNLNNLLNN